MCRSGLLECMGSCSKPAQIFQVFEIVGLSQAPHFAGRWRFGVCFVCGRVSVPLGKLTSQDTRASILVSSGRSGGGRLKPLLPCKGQGWVWRPESIFYLLYVSHMLAQAQHCPDHPASLLSTASAAPPVGTSSSPVLPTHHHLLPSLGREIQLWHFGGSL